MDLPNDRSLHSRPVPRTGGLAVLFGTLASLAFLFVWEPLPPELIWLAASLAMVAAISFLDDLGEVSAGIRLGVHLGAALLLLIGGLGWTRLDLPSGWVTLPAWIGILLTLLYVVWMINLYNFMDGMDGLAAGMAVFGFAALGLLGLIGGEFLYALVAFCIAGAAAGFGIVNFPPAPIFLGDVGSSSLGLLAAGLSLWGVQLGLFPLWTAWLAFSPFIVDATWTLVARAWRRERLWEAHRSHHYQRLVLAGWSHRKTLLRAYVLMAASGACAVAAPRLAEREQWMLLGAWVLIYGFVHLRVRLTASVSAPDHP
ncbi:MraY family glycosyltransferase [Imhoffiella purpurea]|uniref:Undecaprenyl-phosphate N-acetylglucosaminyl 1-phosphate transferase n=1 Tax=Imhoffiella purpurea TaxID=1249627 RepID=W9VLY4_9GAMM|nr:Undecaprenyl-phosphate N-acetylglucosaminyl 1-phosphate transferase [Imhoffiella purpurea]